MCSLEWFISSGRVDVAGRRGALPFQVVSQPWFDEAKDVVHLCGLIASARMPKITEVGSNWIVRSDRLEGEQHSLGFRKRKEIVGDTLNLKNWNACHRDHALLERLLHHDISTTS